MTMPVTIPEAAKMNRSSTACFSISSIKEALVVESPLKPFKEDKSSVERVESVVTSICNVRDNRFNSCTESCCATSCDRKVVSSSLSCCKSELGFSMVITEVVEGLSELSGFVARETPSETCADKQTNNSPADNADQRRSTPLRYHW